MTLNEKDLVCITAAENKLAAHLCPNVECDTECPLKIGNTCALARLHLWEERMELELK